MGRTPIPVSIPHYHAQMGPDYATRTPSLRAVPHRVLGSRPPYADLQSQPVPTLAKKAALALMHPGRACAPRTLKL